MTDPNDKKPPADEGETPQAETATDAEEFPQPEPVAKEADSSLSESTDDLPEDWEMTPEFAEEEAIRGDFVIRWAAILLAVLFGWTHITSTTTLRRIRTGQELSQNGFLPPRTETFFSNTAAERPWVNRAWLGDLLLSSVYSIGGDMLRGDTALTLFGALLAGLAFWLLSRISLPGLPTWGSSVFLTLSVLAVFPLLVPGPTSITIIGLALVLFLLLFESQEKAGISSWWLVPTMLLWSNLDERAYLGIALILLWLIGSAVSRSSASGQRPPWIPGVVAILAALVHPFPLSVLSAPWDLSQTVAPLMLEYGGHLQGEFPFLWRQPIDSLAWGSDILFLPAGAVLFGFAAVSLILNRADLDLRLVVLVVGMNLLGLLSCIDFLATSLCNAVIAGLNCQRWYEKNCPQEYTIESRELLFSRGGRAITVFGLFFLAYWMISGRLTGADGRRIGFGFSNTLRTEIDGYKDLLGKIPEDEFDDHPYHLTPRQGDLLIWHHRKSFTDSRLALYASEETNLLDVQLEIATAMKSPTEQQLRSMSVEEWQKKWSDPLDQYGVTHCILPLKRSAGFAMWVNLSTQAVVREGEVHRFWQPTAMTGPAAMVFRVTPPPGVSDEYAQFLQAQPNGEIVAQTFRNDSDGKETRRAMFPIGPTFYDTKLLLPEPESSGELQMAANYHTRSQSGQRTEAEMLAYSYQVIRHARRGLTDKPNEAQGYHLLGYAYSQLMSIESQMFVSPLYEPLRQRRFLQAFFAWQNASVCKPDNPLPHEQMFLLALANQKPDVALRHLEKVEELAGAYTLLPRDNPQFSSQQQLRKLQRTQLEKEREQAYNRINSVEKEQGLGVAAAMAGEGGFPLKALELIEADLTVIAGNPELSLLYASLLAYDGRLQEAYQQAESVLTTSPDELRFRTLGVAALMNLAPDEIDQAADYWDEYGRDMMQAGLHARLSAMPMASGPVPPDFDIWPALQPALTAKSITEYHPRWEVAQVQVAWCELEQGRNREAGKIFEQIIEANPESGLRLLSAVHLSLLSGQAVDGLTPSQRARVNQQARQRFPDRPPSPFPPERLRTTQTSE